jgi:hypothetical protein
MREFSMRAIRGTISRLAAIAAVIATLGPSGVAPHSIAHAQSGATDELAYGQETGFFFFWDPAALTLDEAASQPGVDYWRLTDGEATLDLWAYNAPEVTTAACVAGFLDQLAADPATVSLEMLPLHGGGPPQVLADSFSEVVLTTSGPDGEEKYAAKVECLEAVPGESLSLEFIQMPARVYNARALESASIEGFDVYLFMGIHSDETAAVTVSDGTDVPAGTMRTFLPCNTAVFDVLAQGDDGQAGFAVDPALLISVDEQGVKLPVSAVAWSLPDVRRETSLNLVRNEIGLLHGVVEVAPNHNFDLYYTGPTGEAIFLAPALWGCGGGGGAPVLIDID